MNCRKSRNKVYHRSSNLLLHYLAKTECSTAQLLIHISQNNVQNVKINICTCTYSTQRTIKCRHINCQHRSTGGLRRRAAGRPQIPNRHPPVPDPLVHSYMLKILVTFMMSVPVVCTNYSIKKLQRKECYSCNVFFLKHLFRRLVIRVGG